MTLHPNDMLVIERDILIATLIDIARESSYEEDPQLTPEHSMGNYDDVFLDGRRQEEFYFAHKARVALAQIGIDYKVG